MCAEISADAEPLRSRERLLVVLVGVRTAFRSGASLGAGAQVRALRGRLLTGALVAAPPGSKPPTELSWLVPPERECPART